jgi:hypothetical protein
MRSGRPTADHDGVRRSSRKRRSSWRRTEPACSACSSLRPLGASKSLGGFQDLLAVDRSGRNRRPGISSSQQKPSMPRRWRTRNRDHPKPDRPQFAVVHGFAIPIAHERHGAAPALIQPYRAMDAMISPGGFHLPTDYSPQRRRMWAAQQLSVRPWLRSATAGNLPGQGLLQARGPLWRYYFGSLPAGPLEIASSMACWASATAAN